MIFVAGLAFTLMVLPKAWAVPAFLAGLMRVFSMHSPGMVNLPVFFTSAVASATRSSTTPAHAFLSRPLLAAKASAMPPFGSAFADAFFFMAPMAFMAFIAFIAFAIAEKIEEEIRSILDR